MNHSILKIKKALYEDVGYTLDYKLSDIELQVLREFVFVQYIAVIEKNYPEYLELFKAAGIESYHTLSHLIDHSAIWFKLNRCLPQSDCDQIKELPFWSTLVEDFGPFKIGEVVYEREIEGGRDEMYWRIVRPNQPTDVGTLHADAWFHKTMNIRDRAFPIGAHALKIWIPLYVEPGKNGLAIIEGSHKSHWDYRAVDIENTMKPRLNCDESKLETLLLNTRPGELVIFNEDLVHVGAVNRGKQTRISLEITMIKSFC